MDTSNSLNQQPLLNNRELFLKDYESIDINSLSQFGCKDFFNFSNNFYLYFTGFKLMILRSLLKIAQKETGLEDPEYDLDGWMNGHKFSEIFNTIEKVVSEAKQELQIAEDFDPDFIYANVIGKSLKDFTSDNLSDADLKIKECLNFMLHVYKKFRNLGLDHWEDLCK